MSQEDVDEVPRDDDEVETGPDYHYILTMPLWSLTHEDKEKLLKLRDAKAHELQQLRSKAPPELWKTDLQNFLAELDVSHLSVMSIRQSLCPCPSSWHPFLPLSAPHLPFNTCPSNAFAL